MPTHYLSATKITLLGKDGEVVIVDEFTGRLLKGRRYNEGLHQAIEAKEAVEIQDESMTLATISFQNYFRLYNKLSGMTGTATTEAEEFHQVYKLDVIEIPPNRNWLVSPRLLGSGDYDRGARALIEVGFDLLQLHKNRNWPLWLQLGRRIAEKMGFTLGSYPPRPPRCPRQTL